MTLDQTHLHKRNGTRPFVRNAARIGVMLGAIALVVASPLTICAQPAPVVIPVLLPMTGGAAFIGQSDVTTIKAAELVVNAHGGIKGRPVKFSVQDTQTNPAISVQLVNGLLAQKVSLIIGPVVTSECLAVAPLLKAGPVDYCLSPSVTPSAESYVYSAGLSGSDFPLLLLRYFTAKHLNRVALITSTDASGQVFDSAFDSAIARPEFKAAQLVAREHFNVTDLNVNAQISRMMAAKPDVAIEWTVGAGFATLLHGTQVVGLDVPIAAAIVNTAGNQMSQYTNLLPKTLLFATAVGGMFGGVGAGPIREAQKRYFAAFSTFGVKPDVSNSQMWDPLMMVVDAYRKIGSEASSEQLQNYLQHLHGWVGINGVYDFRDGSQRGISATMGVVVQWDQTRKTFVPLTRLGGLPK